MFKAYCHISVNVKCIIGSMCHCYLNGLYSKETSLYNNNYVDYCCFQISLWLILSLIGTPILWLQVNDFIVQGETCMVIWEMYTVFDFPAFVKVQFERKVLDVRSSFVQCCGVVAFELHSTGWKKRMVLTYETALLSKKFAQFQRQALVRMPCFPWVWPMQGASFHWLVLEWISECKL